MVINLGKKVKQRREELGLSQEALGKQIGLTRYKVGFIEAGKRRINSLVELPALSKALGRPIEWFFSEDNTEEIEKNGQ